MSQRQSSPRDRAEHYRLLAGLMSDEATHKVLLAMAQECEDEALCGAPGPSQQPMPRSFS